MTAHITPYSVSSEMGWEATTAYCAPPSFTKEICRDLVFPLGPGTFPGFPGTETEPGPGPGLSTLFTDKGKSPGKTGVGGGRVGEWEAILFVTWGGRQAKGKR